MGIPAFCPACRVALDPADAFCKRCGSSQMAPNLAVGSAVAVAPSHLLEEMARQYKAMSVVQAFGIVFLPIYGAGGALVLIGWLSKMALKRRVAETGIDPGQWEAPLLRHASKSRIAALVCLAILLLAGVALFHQYIGDVAHILPPEQS